MKFSTILSKALTLARDLRAKKVEQKFSAQVLPKTSSAKKRVNHMTGQQWAAEAETMIRTDAKIYGAIQQLKNSMLSASWYVEQAGDSEEAARNADFIRRALGLDGEQGHLKSGSFEAELRKSLDFVFVGHQECEEVFYADKSGSVWLAELADIAPTSVSSWNFESDGSLKSITQTATIREAGNGYTPPSQVEVPATKLQIYTLNRKGDDYEGVGVLSPCWVWWQLKDALINYLDEGGEKWSIPTIILSVDRELLTSYNYTEETIDALIERAKEAAREYKGGLENFIAVPQGINVQVFGGGTFDPTKIIQAIDHCNQEMAAAFLSNFLELGISEEGARNIGEIHWNSYKTSIANVLDVVADVWNGAPRIGGGTIAKLLMMNFYGSVGAVPLDKLPRLRHRGVDVDSLADSLGNLPQLAASGFLTPDDATEVKLRRLFGITDRASRQTEEERLGRMHSASLCADPQVARDQSEADFGVRAAGGRPAEGGPK